MELRRTTHEEWLNRTEQIKNNLAKEFIENLSGKVAGVQLEFGDMLELADAFVRRDEHKLVDALKNIREFLYSDDKFSRYQGWSGGFNSFVDQIRRKFTEGEKYN